MRLNKMCILFFVVLLGCTSLLSGCQGAWHPYGSQRILTRHLLLIPGQGRLHVRWESRQLTIEFKGDVDQRLLTMKGDIRITGGGIQHFTMLDHLLVDIYFTDATGTVLNREKFYSTYQSPIDDGARRTFKRSYQLPKRTTHIAFGYDGTAREGNVKTRKSQRDIVKHGFQHSPFR